jgi:hypothetical protein
MVMRSAIIAEQAMTIQADAVPPRSIVAASKSRSYYAQVLTGAMSFRRGLGRLL